MPSLRVSTTGDVRALALGVCALASPVDGERRGRERERQQSSDYRDESCTAEGEASTHTSTPRGIRLPHDHTPFPPMGDSVRKVGWPASSAAESGHAPRWAGRPGHEQKQAVCMLSKLLNGDVAY